MYVVWMGLHVHRKDGGAAYLRSASGLVAGRHRRLGHRCLSCTASHCHLESRGPKKARSKMRRRRRKGEEEASDLTLVPRHQTATTRTHERGVHLGLQLDGRGVYHSASCGIS